MEKRDLMEVVNKMVADEHKAAYAARVAEAAVLFKGAKNATELRSLLKKEMMPFISDMSKFYELCALCEAANSVALKNGWEISSYNWKR